jgi:hypothetical protein
MAGVCLCVRIGNERGTTFEQVIGRGRGEKREGQNGDSVECASGERGEGMGRWKGRVNNTKGKKKRNDGGKERRKEGEKKQELRSGRKKKKKEKKR